VGGFLSGNEIEMPICIYQLDYYCDCFHGGGTKVQRKKAFLVAMAKCEKKPTNTKKMFAFVVLLNNLHKCAGESFKGLTTAKANRVVLYKIFWGIYGTMFLTGGSKRIIRL